MFLAFFSVNRTINNFEHIEKILFENTEKIIILKVINKVNSSNKYNKYKVKAINIIDKKIDKHLYANIGKEININKGDVIKCNYSIEKLSPQRNLGGYNEKLYYYSNNIYAKISIVKVLEYVENKPSLIFKIERTVEKIFNENFNSDYSNFIICMLLGKKYLLTDILREKFTDASLAHILVVSGSHLSYIISFVGLIILNKNSLIKKIVIIVLVITYIVLTDFSISLIRPGLVIVFTILIDEKLDNFKMNILIALGFIVYNPYILMNVSFLLTFASVSGIILIYDKVFAYLQLLIYKYTNKTIIAILKVLAVTLSVQIVLIPIISKYFHKLYLLSIFSNILVVPMSGFLVIISIAYVFLHKIFIIKDVLKFLIILLIDILNIIANLFSSIPYSSIDIYQIRWYEAIIYYVLIYFLFFINKLKKEDIFKIILRNIKLIISILIFTTVILIFISIKEKNSMYINFVDVGQGDCSLIRNNGINILIDGGGTTDNSFDVGKQIVFPYLLSERVDKLDYIIVSHFDVDHVNGLSYILENYKVKKLIYYEPKIKDEVYKSIIDVAKKRRVDCINLSFDTILKISKHSNIIINVPKNKSYESNNSSLICKVKYYEKSILFMGDAESEREYEIINSKNIDIKSDVLKIGHHGSNSSTTKELLKTVNPDYAIIQVGKNMYGHPTTEVLNKLYEENIKILRNDNNGNIEFKFYKNLSKVTVKIN